MIQNYLRHHSLHKIIYPMMALAMILPMGMSAVSPVVANAQRRSKATRTASNAKQPLIYAAFTKNSKKARKHGKGFGRYVIRITFMRNGALRGTNSSTIKKDWGANAGNKATLQKKVNQRNQQLKHSKSAPSNASYLVPKDQQLANGSQSTNAGSHSQIHQGIVPVKVHSRTTLWDLARANLKHFNKHTAHRTVNRMARVLLKLNPKMHSIHATVRKCAVLGIPTKQAKRFKTSFSAWAEFAAGLSKAEQRAKRWIARVESHYSYYIWQDHRRRSGSNVPYGKYQLDHGYLHKDNGHAWYSPYTQENIANQYAYNRYGSWRQAVKFHRSHGWY